jgi:hypothetical protein
MYPKIKALQDYCEDIIKHSQTSEYLNKVYDIVREIKYLENHKMIMDEFLFNRACQGCPPLISLGLCHTRTHEDDNAAQALNTCKECWAMHLGVSDVQVS